MALTRVQSNIANGAGLAPSLDIGSVPASGDLIIVSISIDLIRTISLSGFTLIPVDGDVIKGTALRHAVYYKLGTGVAGTDVITGAISGTGSPNWRMIAVQYHDSVGGTWILDKSSHSTSNSGTASSGTTTATTTAVEVWVGVLTNSAGRTQSAPTNAFTLVQGAAPVAAAAYLYEKIVAATGTARVDASLSSSTNWAGTIATFYSSAPATPQLSVAPVASGTTVVGQAISTDHGTWTNTPTGYTYQWQRDNHGGGAYSNVPGATSGSYLLVDDDDACRLRCQVTAANAGGPGIPAASNAVGLVTEPPPFNTSAPVASGRVIPRGRLSTTPGGWTHMGGYQPQYGYQWQSSPNGATGWADIPGATHPTLTMHTADIGKYFRVQVEAGNTGQPL